MAADDVRVVVVDDEADLREMMQELLQADGYNVRTAADAMDAIKAVAEHRPLAIMVDLGLAETSGVDLVKEIRSRFGTDLVVIILTGSTSAKDQHDAEAAGADYVLHKPIDTDLLRRMLPVIE